MHIKITLKYNFLLDKNPGVWWHCDGRQGKRFFHCWAYVNWCNFYGSQYCNMLQNYKCFCLVSGFLCCSVGKESACNAGYLGWYLGWEDPLEKEMATHFSTISWKIPRVREHGRLQSSDFTFTWTFFGIAFPWDWNKSWSFPVLWPLLSFPNLLAYWV